MRTISLKLPDGLLADLEREAKNRRITKSLLVRQSLEASLRRRPRLATSCYSLARDLAGTVEVCRATWRTIQNIWMVSASEEASCVARNGAAGKLSRWRLVYHAWAVEQWKQLRPPMLTCEPVLTEAAFLLKREGREADALFALLERGIIRIGLAVEDHQADLRALMRRYRNRPMSLADACLVRLSEMHGAAEVLTLDGDFRIYRRHGNKVIPVRMPD